MTHIVVLNSFGTSCPALAEHGSPLVRRKRGGQRSTSLMQLAPAGDPSSLRAVNRDARTTTVMRIIASPSHLDADGATCPSVSAKALMPAHNRGTQSSSKQRL
jgi:hypothetical protein